MKELEDIIRAYDDAEKAGKQSALATVVHLEGSAYRRPGARMLVTEDGKLTGAISGGCLEGDTLRKAQQAMLEKKVTLVTYDTTDDDDAKLGVGLGCNGVISILIEPLDINNEHSPIAFLRKILSERQKAVLVTLFSLEKKALQPGTCMVVTESGVLKNFLTSGPLHDTLITDAEQTLNTETSVTKMYPAEYPLTGFIEIINPAISLVVFGAGNDAIPLVQMATILGWETTVIDGRPSYASAQRFPFAHRVVISKAESAIPQLTFDKNTVAVLMSHNYNYDIAALRGILSLHLPYIGVLGPKKKLTRMIEELKEEGLPIDDASTGNLFGPAGFDLGAETAEEIALSILSEIKAILSKKTGSSLREKEAVIHPRENQNIIHGSIST
jgi:xanthine/CO dehydrogenase XdhC/CoxF family maturation factor